MALRLEHGPVVFGRAAVVRQIVDGADFNFFLDKLVSSSVFVAAFAAFGPFAKVAVKSRSVVLGKILGGFGQLDLFSWGLKARCG